jgi:hypothetical protein
LLIGLGWLLAGMPVAAAKDRAGGSAHAVAHAPSERSLRASRIEDLVPGSRDRCVAIGDVAAGTAQQEDLLGAVKQLQKAVLGRWLVQQALARSVMICQDGRTELEAYYRAHLRLIGLNARLDPAERLVFLAHELAHVPQHPRFSNNRRFAPEDMLLLQRVREATAEAVATRTLWQLRAVGMEAPWQAKLKTAYGDIVRVFATSMGRRRGDAAELLATRTAFQHWFEAAWRLHIYDDLMLKTLARIADDQIGMLPSSRWLSDGFLLGIARYGGTSFLIEGDGRRLIGAFETSLRTSGRQARLDAILGRARVDHAGSAATGAESAGDGLSASSSGPIDVDQID